MESPSSPARDIADIDSEEGDLLHDAELRKDKLGAEHHRALKAHDPSKMAHKNQRLVCPHNRRSTS